MGDHDSWLLANESDHGRLAGGRVRAGVGAPVLRGARVTINADAVRLERYYGAALLVLGVALFVLR